VRKQGPGFRSQEPEVRRKRPTLSRGERVDGDGAFTSRRRTGEGFLPWPTKEIVHGEIFPES
jgi:hypothetical protein